MSPVGLAEALATLPSTQSDDLLVGFETSDDAGVYRIQPDLALVQTVDFITPPLEEPDLFGRIAAANSLSDVYAMGGTPLTALNVVMFPDDRLGVDLLREIFTGAAQTALEADVVILGGHTVRDREPKYGLAVTGRVHPDHIWRNRGIRPGDALLLTKALGTGVLFNANRRRRLPPSLRDPLVASCLRLNRRAAETLRRYDVHACTDVTGFGLAGHLLEMARASGVDVHVTASRLPLLPGALEAYGAGVTTGSNEPNRAMVAEALRGAEHLQAATRELLFDPQTSGGLLVALPAEQAGQALGALHEAGDVAAARIGHAEPCSGPHPILTVG